MPAQHRALLELLPPQTNGRIGAGTGQSRAVGAPRQRPNRLAMPAQHRPLLELIRGATRSRVREIPLSMFFAWLCRLLRIGGCPHADTAVGVAAVQGQAVG